ncbi:hypothetical protein L596_012008 [Steinernema carpocapsae]|uniref:Uncharacterized protein n=1 Tax=Steinernema carpocapsae TaxID=34508 RepID=A0A4U5NWF2_STECR|nr:hypothetical protein L596_012008 [Steinernema carpocapsae]
MIVSSNNRRFVPANTWDRLSNKPPVARRRINRRARRGYRGSPRHSLPHLSVRVSLPKFEIPPYIATQHRKSRVAASHGLGCTSSLALLYAWCLLDDA